MIEIIDNYFSEEEFLRVENYFNEMDWTFWPKANPASTDESQFQFARVFYDKMIDFQDDRHMDYMVSIVKPMTEYKKNQVGVVRGKANFYIRVSDKQFGLGFHRDISNCDAQYWTLIVYMEDSNGFTEFKNGERVESVRNRAAIFPAEALHQTYMQSDTLFRRNININFVELK